MKITIEEFWNRFKAKSDKLMDLDSLNAEEKNEILTSLDEDLKQYSEGLSFEISKLGTNGRKLTLTAEGDVDYFEDLINLYEQSPILDFWDIVAFKQGKGPNVNISFASYHLSSKKMWFMPMENSEDEEMLGLQIALDSKETEDEDLLVGLYRSGTPKRDICKTLQRTESGVAARLVHLGIIENRDIFRDRK